VVGHLTAANLAGAGEEIALEIIVARGSIAHSYFFRCLNFFQRG